MDSQINTTSYTNWSDQIKFTQGHATETGLSVGELAADIGVDALAIKNFQSVTGGWTFTMGGVDFKFSIDGKLSYKGTDGRDVAFDINISNGLSAEEVKLFNWILERSNSTASSHVPTSLFDKMIQAISQQMNEMFLDIMSMSTVLSSGTGLRGIMLLAEKGVMIDGVAISDMISGDTGVSLIQLQELMDNSPDISDITVTDGLAKITLGDGTIFNINLKGTKLEFVLTPAVDGNFTMDNLDVKISNSASILESPGTLFLVQTLLQQMKDAMQAIGAVGKVAGDVMTTANQSFVRDVNG